MNRTDFYQTRKAEWQTRPAYLSFGILLLAGFFMSHMAFAQLATKQTGHIDQPVVTATSTTNMVPGDGMLLTTLACEKCQYQWLRNGIAVPNATGPQLLATFNGSYSVMVTNARGVTDTAMTTHVFLNKPQVPEATNQTASEASKINVVPSTEKKDENRYVWLKDNLVISYATTDSLTSFEAGDDQQVLEKANNTEPIEDKISINAVANAGISNAVNTTGIDENGHTPATKSTAFPNPYVERTTVSYEINEPQRVAITVFDATGKKIVATQPAMQPMGEHTFELKGNKPGTYFIQLHIGNSMQTVKVLQLDK